MSGQQSGVHIGGCSPLALKMPPGSKNYDFEARLYRPKRNRACDTCRKRKGEQ